MKAYKFETTVLKNGIIQLPQISEFANREIEIFIVLKQNDRETGDMKKQTADRFINKWRGFLKGTSPDDLKFKYISEKYK